MLLVECTPDETIARKLGCHRRACLHLNDKGRVCRRMQRLMAIKGLVDEDPGAAQPGYINSLVVSSDEHDICCLDDRPRQNRLIILRPRLEEWLIRTSYAAGVAMDEFGLSLRGNELHREIISRIPALERLLDKLIEVREPRLSHLRQLILTE